MFILKNATANRNNAIILQNILECIVHIFRQILVTVTNLQFVDQNDMVATVRLSCLIPPFKPLNLCIFFNYPVFVLLLM